MFRIYYCTNSEILDGRKVDFDCIDSLVFHDEHVGVFASSQFERWRGGDGEGSFAYLLIDGYGRVENKQQAKEAVAWLIREDRAWPSQMQVFTALAMLARIRECYDNS